MINQILTALHCDNVPSPYQPVKLCYTTYDNASGTEFGFQVHNPLTGETRSLGGFHSETEAEAAMGRCIEIMTGEHYEREREAAPDFKVVGSTENRWAEPGFDSIGSERDSRHSVCTHTAGPRCKPCFNSFPRGELIHHDGEVMRKSCLIPF